MAKKRKTTLKEARAKEAAKHEKKIAEQEKRIAELETQVDFGTSTGQPLPEKTEEERAEAKKITLHHKFRPNPLRFANYVIQKPEYGYYWQDTGMVERQGWGIWERVDKSNHEILKNTRVHADGRINVGTLFMCYAPIEDVMAQETFNAQRTDSMIPGLKEAYLEEEKRIAGHHYGGVGTAFGEGIEEKQMTRY